MSFMAKSNFSYSKERHTISPFVNWKSLWLMITSKLPLTERMTNTKKGRKKERKMGLGRKGGGQGGSSKQDRDKEWVRVIPVYLESKAMKRKERRWRARWISTHLCNEVDDFDKVIHWSLSRDNSAWSSRKQSVYDASQSAGKNNKNNTLTTWK